MACGRTPEERDLLRFKNIESILPFVQGTIIKEDGSTVDLPDFIGAIPKTPMDPQIAKSQRIFPYIRNTVILKDGMTCRLTDILQALLAIEEVTTANLRLLTVELTEADW